MSRLWAGMLAFAIVLAGCGPKHESVRIPPGYTAVRSATLDELVDLVNGQYAEIETVSVGRFRVKFTGGSMEKGYLKEYPSAKGHLVTKRPHWIYVNILNPVTSSSVVAMASDSQEFQIWVPRENKYLTGKTDVRTDSNESLHRVRPEHLLQAILVEPLLSSEAGTIHFLEEERDEQRKYYVIHQVLVDNLADRGCLQRKLWLERQNFGLARQQYYNCGKLTSDIRYGGVVVFEHGALASTIALERVAEHYQISFQFDRESIRLNRSVDDSSFYIPKPPRAELVIVEGPGLEDNDQGL